MTVFPGISVIRIDTESSIVGTDDGDAIEGFFDSITPEFIDEKLGTRDKLMYSLVVNATNETSARAKAKAFVRAKNPFEVTNVQITSLDKKDDKGFFNAYSIGVGITKQGLGD